MTEDERFDILEGKIDGLIEMFEDLEQDLQPVIDKFNPEEVKKRSPFYRTPEEIEEFRKEQEKLREEIEANKLARDAETQARIEAEEKAKYEALHGPETPYQAKCPEQEGLLTTRVQCKKRWGKNGCEDSKGKSGADLVRVTCPVYKAKVWQQPPVIGT